MPNQPPMGKNHIVKRLLELSAKEGLRQEPLPNLIKWELIMAPFYRFKECVKAVKNDKRRI